MTDENGKIMTSLILSNNQYFTKPLKTWCCRRDLNSRPLPYQGSALPLSYGSNLTLLIFPDVLYRISYSVKKKGFKFMKIENRVSKQKNHNRNELKKKIREEKLAAVLRGNLKKRKSEKKIS